MNDNPYATPRSRQAGADSAPNGHPVPDQPISGMAVFFIHLGCLVAVGGSGPLLLYGLTQGGPFPLFPFSPLMGAAFAPLGAIPLAIHSILYAAYAENGAATYSRALLAALLSVVAASCLVFFSSDSLWTNFKLFLMLAAGGVVVLTPTVLLGHWLCMRLLIGDPASRPPSA